MPLSREKVALVRMMKLLLLFLLQLLATFGSGRAAHNSHQHHHHHHSLSSLSSYPMTTSASQLFSSKRSSLAARTVAVHAKHHPTSPHNDDEIFSSMGTSSSSSSRSSSLSATAAATSATTTLAATISSSSTTDTTMSRGGSLRPPIRNNDDNDSINIIERKKDDGEDEQDQEHVAAVDASSTISDVVSAAAAAAASTDEIAASSTNYDDDLTATTPSSAVDLPLKKKGGLLFLRRRHRKDKNYKTYAKRLKNRNATNVRRKILHGSWGLLFAALHHFLPRPYFLTGMAVLSTGTLAMELLRYQPGFTWMNDVLHFTLGSSLRKHEMEGKFTGSFYFFTGVTLTAWQHAANPVAATLGMCQLALADPSASYFGRATRHVYWSRIENGLGGIGRNKGLLGFLGGALFCFPFNFRVLSIAKYVTTNGATAVTATTMLPGGTRAVVLASLALGFAGALADLAVPSPAVVLPKVKIWGVRVPPLHLDDNFVVPICSAWACEAVFGALHWHTSSSSSSTCHVQLAKYVLFDRIVPPWVWLARSGK